MCILPSNQAPSQEPPSPSLPERTNTEPQPEPINSEPQPPPEPASESRKRAMPEPCTSEPNSKPHHEPKRQGVSSGSTPPPSPPPSLITVEFTDAFVEDLFKYLPMPLDELNRKSPSSRSILPPPPPPTSFGEDLFKFLPSTLFDEPQPLNTVFPSSEENEPILLSPDKDWSPPVSSNIDERISALADPIDHEDVFDAPYLNCWDKKVNLRRRKLSAVISPSVSYVSVDHYGNTDVPIATPLSRSVGAGIENLRNTCFMAAILQCLTHTGQMFLGIRYCFHETPCSRGGFCVICAFRDHNDRALDPSRNTIHPALFVRNVNQFSDNFVAHSQEDAHEFMICALNKLKSAFPEGHNNLIEQIFGGKTVSQLRCRSCGFSSDTIEPIFDLGLAVDNVSTVERALDSYIMVENMDGMFKCSGCHQEVYMEKQLLIYKAPEIAVLHLKRFKKDGSTYGKIQNHVYFTPKLDLKPYTSAKGREDPILMYHLYAVVVHSGSRANSGHYFSYVRSDEDTWHLMDDSKVLSVSEEHVLAQPAYMLFYAKQGTAWFSSILKTEERSVLKSKSIDNTQDFGSGEKIFFDLTEATDDDSMRGNDSDSTYGIDSGSTYGIDTDSLNGKEKTASDMEEEEECDSAGANDKDSKDADDNDSKVTNEKSGSGMDGEECDLVDDDKDSKDADDNDSKVTIEKSVTGMDGEECDLVDANDDKDSKDADDDDSKVINEKSASHMDVEECDLADANDDKDSKDADDDDSKDTNEKSVSGMDVEECDLSDANDNDSKDASVKSVSGMDVVECDLSDANDENDSKDADDKDSKDANEKSVSGMDGADGNDSKDANDNDSNVTNEKSVNGMDVEECDLADAIDKDSKDANDDNDSKVANERLGSDMDEDEMQV
ncbi:unnamed protein product [Lathyrus oleraceus]